MFVLLFLVPMLSDKCDTFKEMYFNLAVDCTSINPRRRVIFDPSTYKYPPKVPPAIRDVIQSIDAEVLGGSLLNCGETLCPGDVGDEDKNTGKAINHNNVRQKQPSYFGETLRTSGDGGDGGEDLYEALHENVNKYGAPPVPKCVRRGFKKLDCQVFMCAALDCQRVIHESFYMVVTQSNRDMDLLPPGVVVCKKRCCKKYLKGIEKQEIFQEGVIDIPWDRDRRLGESDPNTSMTVLLKWWMSEGNYAKYRGTNTNSETQKM